MAKQKTDLPQAGVSTETTGNAVSNQTNDASAIAGSSNDATGNAPEGAAQAGKEISALPENAKTEDLQTETVPENAAANEAANAEGAQNSEDEFAGVREDQRPLHQHAKEEAARIGNSEVDGGKEYVGAGVHKGREIKNGVIDFSTPSARELAMQKAAENSASENSASAASGNSEASERSEEESAPSDAKKAA